MTTMPDSETLLTIQEIINSGLPSKKTLDDIAHLLKARTRRICKRAQYVVSINFDDEGEGDEAYGDLVMAAHTISRNYRVTIDFSYDRTVEIDKPRRWRCGEAEP